MHLIHIGNRVINLQALTFARLDMEEDKACLILGFMDDGVALEIEGEEGLVVWNHITQAPLCKQLFSMPKQSS